jgi:hypothetical protein
MRPVGRAIHSEPLSTRGERARCSLKIHGGSLDRRISMKKLLAMLIASAFALNAFAQAQKAEPAAPKSQTGVETQKAEPATPAKGEKKASSKKTKSKAKAKAKNGETKAKSDTTKSDTAKTETKK